MFFNLFRKKEGDGQNSEIKNLNKKLSSSFSNIKTDMNNLAGWVDVLDQKDKGQEEILKKVLSRLDKIENLLEHQTYEEEILEEPEEIVEEEHEEIEESTPAASVKGLLSAYNSLTDTQKKLFKELYRQQSEKGGRWISQIEFALEVYPDRSYSAVRTTLSDYLSVLEDMGLIKRKRMNRKVSISVTQLAKEFIQKAEKEFEKKSLKKKKSEKLKQKTKRKS
jgi:hypothetical protein